MKAYAMTKKAQDNMQKMAKAFGGQVTYQEASTLLKSLVDSKEAVEIFSPDVMPLYRSRGWLMTIIPESDEEVDMLVKALKAKKISLSFETRRDE